MPRICEFLGIVIRMYVNDHYPMHFHASYAEHEALFRIDSLELIAGSLPRRAHALVLEWAALHREELIQNWERARLGKSPRQIKPLE